MSVMKLDIDMLMKVMNLKAKGFEVLISDRGLYLQRKSNNNTVLAASAEKLITIHDEVELHPALRRY